MDPMDKKTSTIITVSSGRVSCNGAGAIRDGENYASRVLGHPQIWLEIDEGGEASCGYCGQRFVREGSAADTAGH